MIGNIGSYTGPEASSIGPGEKVIQAWASEVNATGGINGRHVKLIVMDDGASPTNGLREAKQLITQDKVVAIVGDDSLAGPVWAPVAEAAGVPVIGGYPSFPPFETSPDFFASGTTLIPQLYSALALGRPFGPNFGSLFCVEAPVCATQGSAFKFMAPSLKMKVVAASVSATAPNYTAQCQALKQFGAQSYEVTQAASVALKILDACVAQGVTAKPTAGGGIANSTWLSHASAQGLANAENDFPYFYSATPATKAYQALLAKYSLGDGGGGGGTYTYVGAKLFQAAAESVGKAPITSQALKAALYKMKNETLGGLAPPLNFSEGKPSVISCWFEDRIENHKWTAPNGLQPTCAPAPVIAAAIAKLGL